MVGEHLVCASVPLPFLGCLLRPGSRQRGLFWVDGQVAGLAVGSGVWVRGGSRKPPRGGSGAGQTGHLPSSDIRGTVGVMDKEVIEVLVRKEDGGERNSADGCPLARAIGRTLTDVTRVAVSPRTVAWFEGDNHVGGIIMDDDTIREVKAYDDGGPLTDWKATVTRYR